MLVLFLFFGLARYLLDNREVQIEWQYASEPGGQASETAALETPRKIPLKCG